MKLSWRTGAALIILAISLVLLVWGFWPTPSETHILPIDPSNLTLPTPSAFVPAVILTA